MFLLGLIGLLFLPVYWLAVPTRARPHVFVAVALAALAGYAPKAVLSLGVLAVVVYALVGGARRSRGRCGIAALLALAVLVAHKLGVLGGTLLGASYATFRLIHVALDVAAGRLRVGNVFEFVEYVLFPPYFLSGPIARYQEHAAGMRHQALSLDDVTVGLLRLVAGLAKKVLLAAPLMLVADSAFAAKSLTTGHAWQGLMAYSLGIYLDFSAYTDMALGVARLFGFEGPENFDWPYLASDIGEFWRRWHMTLTGWLRDYVYIPVTGLLARPATLRRQPLLVGALASLVTMLLCGLWHGASVSFAVWGLGHGALLGTHQWYRQRVLSRLPPERRRELTASLPYRVAATLATFLCVSLLWLVFRLPPAEAEAFAGRLVGLGS